MPNTKATLQLNVVLEPCFSKYLLRVVKDPVPVPISLVPSFAAQDTCAAGRYAEGTHIVINGRLYPNEDGKMYVVPTQPLESLKMPINLNQVNLAGNVGSHMESKDVRMPLTFGMMVQAPPQKSIRSYLAG